MPLVIQFLSQIRQFVRCQNGDELRSWLQVEPGSPQEYHKLAAELRSQFRQQGLDDLIEKALPQEDDVPEGQATAWPGFVAFMKDYLTFWRDINYDDLLGAHQLLSGLVKYVHPHVTLDDLRLSVLTGTKLLRHSICASYLRCHAPQHQHVSLRDAGSLHHDAQPAS